ncbi:hypothetical protein MSZK_21980 [Mycobacterium sp. shizuoka-1]|nr:hypothetical protein MSZK_21980 [Mycobacterium sp. shizuoka-1]
MKGCTPIRVARSMVIAAGVVLLAGCGSHDEPAPATSGPSVSPTSKATLPGVNNFSPSPIAPLNPTANPGDKQTQHP